MKVLFCHDGPLRRDQSGKYYGTAHNNDTFKRYYDIGDELIVAIRVNEINSLEAKKSLSQITVKPFEVIECPNMSSLKRQIFNRKKTEEIISKEVQKSDYIIARLPSVIGFIGVDMAKKYNKPYLVEVVACPLDVFWNHSIKGKVLAPFMYYATKKRVRNAYYSLYVTNKFLQKRYPTNGEKISCSDVALKESDEKILEARIEKIKNMRENNKIVIGTTGAVDIRYKGQQFVIQALGKLKKEGITNYEYQLVGGGNQTFLKAVADKYDVTNQVKFLGSLSHGKVIRWLDSLDLYIQPSMTEGLPRALVEAISRGIPSLGSDVGGIPELLDSKFIFSNTRNNIGEICILLNAFDKKVMTCQAVKNFKESRKYDKEILEARRKQFFMEFKNSIKEH